MYSKAELESNTKEELIKFILECQSELRLFGEGQREIDVYNKLKKNSSLNSQIHKIQEASQHVGAIMFRIYNIERSDLIFKRDASKQILQDVVKLLKSKMRNTDILIKYNEHNFIIIAPSTKVEGIDKYAHKLNELIVSNVFGSISHLKSNFALTIVNKEDEINVILNRLYKALVSIEQDSSRYFIKV
jgi:GGDEF domain-containing protein